MLFPVNLERSQRDSAIQVTRSAFDEIVTDLVRNRRGVVHAGSARAIFAACSRLDKLLNTLERHLRDYRRKAYHLQFDEALANTPNQLANEDGRNEAFAESFAVHGRSLVHELAGPITAAKNLLKTIEFTPPAVEQWRRQVEPVLVKKVELLISDSTVITTRLAIRDAIKPEHRHPDPTLGDE